MTPTIPQTLRPATLTLTEAAQYTGATRYTLRKLIRDGRLPAIRLGHRLLFRQTTLDRVLGELEAEQDAQKRVPMIPTTVAPDTPDVEELPGASYTPMIADGKQGPAAGNLPRIWTATELCATQFPPPVWAVPGLLPEGLAIFAGKSKLGKSRLALSLAVAVASGGRALGSIPVTEPGSVLYLQLEHGEELEQERLRIMCDGTPPALLHSAFVWPRGEEGVSALALQATKMPDLRLVVVDTMARLLAPRRGADRDLYASAYETLTPLLTLAHERHFSLVLVTHTRKQLEEGSDWQDAVLGSVGIVGSADTVLGLFRARHGDGVTLHARGRRLKEEVALALECDTRAGWQVIGTPEEVAQSRERSRLHDAVREIPAAGERVTPKAVALSLGESGEKGEARIRTLLRRMVNDGELRSPAYGEYALPVQTHSHPSQQSYCSQQSHPSQLQIPPTESAT